MTIDRKALENLVWRTTAKTGRSETFGGAKLLLTFENNVTSLRELSTFSDDELLCILGRNCEPR